ncbi:hypothetical protein MXD81_24235, partial [Microbacteriaceae bacterium K1510]|nr:hypothetical protein [Microbacteriaceae bacterium K1510]
MVIRNGVIPTKIGPLKEWNRYRQMPALPAKSFRDNWHELDREIRRETRQMDDEIRNRLEKVLT